MQRFKDYIAVEQIDEYRKPTEAEIKKDKERENAGKKRPSMDHKSASKKIYGNMMGGLKEEEFLEAIEDYIISENLTMEDIENLDEAQLDEISKETLKRYADKAASDARWAHYDSQTHRPIHWKTREKHFKRYSKRRKGVGSVMKRGLGTDDHVDQIKGHDSFDYTDKKNPNKGDKVKRWKGDWIKRRPKENSMTDKKAPYKHESVELSEADIAEILRQYALSENVNADQLATLTEEEITEIIGKVLGGIAKGVAKAGVRAVYNKQGNVRGSMAAKNDKIRAKLQKTQQKRAQIVKNRTLQRSLERAQKKLARSQAAAQKYNP